MLDISNLGLVYVIKRFTQNYEIWDTCSRELCLSIECFKMHINLIESTLQRQGMKPPIQK